MAVALILIAAAVNGWAQNLVRHESFVPSDSGIEIFVREVRDQAIARPRPLLLIHGARVPGVASFDLRVEGGSLAGDLAKSGYRVYVLDVRGYGRSTRPREMSEAPQAHPPLVRSQEAVRDIDAVVNWIRETTGSERVSILGWATGGQWAGY